jgi:hypothetical protein
MNNAGLGGLVPGSEGFIQKRFSGLRIFRRDGGFHFAGERADLAPDLEIVLGMGVGLPVRFESGCVTSCL